MSTDPAEQFWDRYAYAGNNYNPINSIDPDGRAQGKISKAVVHKMERWAGKWLVSRGKDIPVDQAVKIIQKEGTVIVNNVNQYDELVKASGAHPSGLENTERVNNMGIGWMKMENVWGTIIS